MRKKDYVAEPNGCHLILRVQTMKACVVRTPAAKCCLSSAHIHRFEIVVMSLSSPLSSHQAKLPPTPESKIAPSDSVTPSLVSVYYTPLHTPGRPLQCVLCLGPHAVCPLVPEADSDRLIQVREKKISRPGKPKVSNGHFGVEAASLSGQP